MPMSEETRKIIKECVRETSGEMREIKTVCPECKNSNVHMQMLEVEFINDAEAMRNPNTGTLIVLCKNCRESYIKRGKHDYSLK
jgi:ssDNA-binding Zn-finger/Zn-ribbon topoisomerase 1